MLVFFLGFVTGMAVLTGACALVASLVDVYGERL